MDKNVKEPTVRYNTVRNYRERYSINIKSIIGHMLMTDVKPMHCQNVLNCMADKYKGSTIEQTRITMCSMFYYAMINGIIAVSPINKMVKLPRPIEKKVHFLTIDEKKRFFEVADGTAYADQFIS